MTLTDEYSRDLTQSSIELRIYLALAMVDSLVRGRAFLKMIFRLASINLKAKLLFCRY